MTTKLSAINQTNRKSPRRFLKRWGQDTSGTTAIEFAIVGVPFIGFCFAVIGYGFYFFTNTALEFGVETASRKIRTGQAQTNAITRDAFRNEICAAAGTFIDCSSSKLKIHIQSAASWAGIAPTPCQTGNGLTDSGGAGSDPVSGASGGARQAVLVTACYEWTLAQTLPFLFLGQLDNGSAIVQAVATFRTEPYQ